MDVDWGTDEEVIDYLIIDSKTWKLFLIIFIAPPGTSDEHISIVNFLEMNAKSDGAILVTTP